MDDTQLPRDPYSQTLRRLMDHPDGVPAGNATIDLVTMLGHSETWIVKTIRVEGADTVFLQRIDADSGMRLVLPPEVTAAIARHRERAVTVNRRRAARRGVATKQAKKGKPAK